ncbi:family 43 glycosylhydrolase [Thalassobellus citreus]|uniref:family 43 glycosylhydrolase n=1 Tax=Thalassobellus citreus TaxID=3367752 RepID=UPI0037998913
MKIRILIISILCLFFTGLKVSAQYNAPGNGNPIVPGYFADPTIKKFGDTWYLYATTDAIELASGDPQVWVSKDFKNWSNYKFDLPNLKTEDVWAPDIVEGDDGRYYYYYSSCRSQYGGCNIFGYVSDTPIGPWVSMTNDGSPVLPANFNEPIIPLDPHVFKDDDGSYYIYYCTWATYNGHGVGWAKLDVNMMPDPNQKGIIPNTQLPDVFEAPYMLKKDGVYYLSYSAGSTHDDSYRVLYATSNSPTGTFTAGANNPITEATNNGISAPGHHSFFKDGEDYYIAYHRHTNPNGLGGLVRQVCVDPVTFGVGKIEKVNLTHTGIGLLGTDQILLTDLAYQKTVTASSYYSDDINNYDYLPMNAVDQNNGTIWKAGTSNMGEWLQIDLGSTQNVKRILTDFEFPIYYYQYKIEYSSDATNWMIYADKTQNKKVGSPMLDDGDVMARYIKVTVTGVQKAGLFPAIWNIKVYNNTTDFSVFENPEQTEGPVIVTRGNKLLDINASSFSTGEKITELQNLGTLGGTFTTIGNIIVEDIDNRRGFTFGGSDYMELSKRNPDSQTWNAPYTVSTWVNNPNVGPSECILTWANRGGPMGTYAALNYGTNNNWGASAHWDQHDMGYTTVPEKGKWHNITLTFDGNIERVYVDGVLNAQEQKNLYVNSNGRILVGFSGDAAEYLTGTIASLKMYDYSLSESEIAELYTETGCSFTSLFPEFQLEQGSLLPTQKVGVNLGTSVKLHPSFHDDETDTGKWSWTGPNGFTSQSRDIILSSVADSEFGEYKVSYTNSCDIESSQTFILEKAKTTLANIYSSCSLDNGSCSYPHSGKVNIAYGSPGNYFYIYNVDGNFNCNNTYFGDPAPEATDKQCYVEELDPFDGNIAVFAEVTTDYVSNWEELFAVNNGITPTSSTDKNGDAYGNWPSPDTFRYVQYNWEQEYYITLTDIYWWTDNNGILIPTEAYVEYWDGTAWVKWNDIGIEADSFNELTSETILTNSLRVTFKNNIESTGILEWRAYGTIENPLAVNNIETNGDLLRIHPNPTDSNFVIELNNQKLVRNMDVTIYDVLGKEIYHSLHKGNNRLILNKSTLGMVNSMYFVKVKMDETVITNKLLIK